MAIAFARVSIHSRSKGHSAVAASAYRTGSVLLDERTGQIHDYSNRQDVVYSDILLPDGADSRFGQREFLWNQAELAENRRDAQVCKDIVLALPKELDLNQHIEMTQRFARTHFVENSLPADIAIHDHGDGNPHAHILIPTRRLEHHQFSKYKAQDLNPAFAKDRVVENDLWGERWRDFQADYFIEKHIDLAVDLNHLLSERHQGSNKNYLAEENRFIRQTRQELAKNSVETVIKHLSDQHSVFARRDVEKLLFKTFKDSDKPEEYLQLVEQVMSHRNLVELGANDKGVICFTTREQYIREARLRHDIEKMMRRESHLDGQQTDTLSRQYTLSDEQQGAFRHIVESPAISVVVGRPGTGKSYLLKPVKDFYQQHQYQVIGCSLSGKVAKALQADTGIQSSTIASLVYRINQKQLKLTKKHVLVMDEAGMVDCNNMAFLIHQAKKAGSKVVLVGDPDQLKPIHKGEIFRGIAAITSFVELENIKCQRDAGDRQASLDMSKGHIDKALQHYQEKGAVMLAFSPDEAKTNMISDWKKSLNQDNLKDSILLSFTRAAVTDLNDKARQTLQEMKLVGQENIEFKGQDKTLKI